MSLRKELKEDSQFIKEVLKGAAAKEYVFSGKYGPVVAMHGINGGWTRDGLRLFMEENDVAGTLVYRNLIKPNLETHLLALKSHIEDYDNPLLVGLSAGGLLMLDTVNRYDLWGRIKKIVTIATPFGGIDYKFLAGAGSGVADVVKGSEYINRIAQIHPPEDKIISIFAREDKFLPHPESLKLDWQVIITDAQAHGEVQNHQKWYSSILKKELGINI